MGHFAKVLNGKVVQVIVAEQEFFENFVDSAPGEWIQTSYNTRGNVHYLSDSNEPSGNSPLRGNFAGINYNYDSANDVFYAPQPYESWILNTTTWTWEAPVVYPQDGGMYVWNDSTQSWDAI